MHDPQDPSVICLSHQAVEQQLKSIMTRQTRAEKRVDSIQESLLRIEVKITRVATILGSLLVISHILLKVFFGQIVG